MENLRRYFRPVLFQLIIYFVMFWNTGFLQNAYELIENDERSPMEIATLSENVWNLAEHKIELAKQKVARGEVYAPADYFKDIAEIEQQQKRLNISIHFPAAQLQDLMNKSITSKRCTIQDLDNARETYKRQLEDNLAHRDEFKQELKQLGWGGFFCWLMSFYFWNLIPVALLYIVWMLQQQLEERRRHFCFPSPLNFAWTVVAHPFYLTRIFVERARQSGRKVYVEAEYRRTKSKLFTYLTEREQRRIKEFADSGLQVFAWRRYLRLNGLKPLHTLAAVLAVMIVIAVLPKPTEAKTNNHGKEGSYVISWQQLSTNLARMNIEPDDGQIDGQNLERNCFFEWEEFNFLVFPQLVLSEFLDLPFNFQEVLEKFVHIPINRLFNSMASMCFMSNGS